ncbi:MAG: galactokinase [Phycisphaerales bacterium]|nr:galactokinase [Phycisphaerales bacterium]
MNAATTPAVQPARRAQLLLDTAWPGNSDSPRITAIAPGRVNLIGEHTDYSGGFVLPMAIDLACAAALRIRNTAKVSRVAIEGSDLRAEFELDRLLAPGGELPAGVVLGKGDWRSYVVGVIALLGRRARHDGKPLCGFDLAIAGDVPVGGGLSSSAALEVSVASAVAAAWNVHLDLPELAALCRQAEHEFAGVPCGIMDQFISALGRAGHALLLDCRTLEHHHVPMPAAEHATVVVFNSNVSHSLASGEYARRREACQRAAAVLGVGELRDATPQMVASNSALVSQPALFRAARHVVTENARTIAAAAALERGDLTELGRLMNASHDSLRDDYRVSCPELDTLVEAGRGLGGVFGARMTGGGFGGCAVMLVRSASVDSVIADVKHAYRARHGLDATAFPVRASGGATVLRTAG